MYFKTSYLSNSKKFPVETFDWNVKEDVQNHEKYPHLVDFFAKSSSIESKKIRPFVDFDMTFDSAETLPSDSEEKAIREGLQDVFRGLFLNDNIKIIAAYRKKGFATNKKRDRQSGDLVEHGKYKISYRLYANKVFTTREDLHKHLNEFMPDLSKFPDCVKNYSFDCNSLFDTGVYCDKNRSMACVGKTKSKYDSRILYQEDDNEHLENYLIQNVQPDDEPVEWAKHTTFIKKKTAGKKIAKAAVKRVREDLHETSSEDSDFVHVETDAEEALEPAQKKVKVARPETIDSEHCPRILEEEIVNLITDTFNIRKSDLKKVALLEHAFVTYIKAPYYCLHTKTEHTESNPKMYVSISRKKLNYYCSVCDKSMIKKHSSTIVAEHFPETSTAVVQPGEKLDLAKFPCAS
ncbi:hypothetical protein DFS34DRAFT_688907 [Phlyctochytrium arcticum]|nr:hypothetical protein DFS34DRAFT_688907 [Phlyctochytrium arcticum]